jgi:transposase-like protein
LTIDKFYAILGKDNRLLLYCKTCKKCFSETRCTAFLGTKYSREIIQKILRTVAEGNGVRATARILELSKDGVNRIILIAGEYCEQVLANLLTSLALIEVQLGGL